jgi:hypothetical protein
MPPVDLLGGPRGRACPLHALVTARVAAGARPAFFGLDVAERRVRHRKIGHGFQAANSSWRRTVRRFEACSRPDETGGISQ